MAASVDRKERIVFQFCPTVVRDTSKENYSSLTYRE